MSEDLEMAREGFKIFRNPDSREASPVYMGEYYPPQDRPYFTQRDLQELGFPPGLYTVLIPPSVRKEYVVPNIQSVRVHEC